MFQRSVAHCKSGNGIKREGSCTPSLAPEDKKARNSGHLTKML